MPDSAKDRGMTATPTETLITWFGRLGLLAAMWCAR